MALWARARARVGWVAGGDAVEEVERRHGGWIFDIFLL